MSTTLIENQKIHPSFRLNSKGFTNLTLVSYAKVLIETGAVYEAAVGNFILNWLDNSMYVTVYTSGSTGNPKAIKILKKHMINSAKATGKFFKVLEDSNVLLCLSADYIAGKMMLVRAMVLGWRLDVVAPKASPLETVLKCYDFCAMVPMQLDNSIARLHLIKKLIVGGAPISEHQISLVQDIKTKIYETYGMTETVSHIAVRKVNSKKRAFKDSYFKALPKVMLSKDKRGCLVIQAPLVAKDTVTTNDIVELHSHKKFTWKGRIDIVINSGGVKLFPEGVERKFQLIIRNRFFISWIPDSILGQQLILIIEDVTNKCDASIIFNRIKQLDNIKKYEIPKKIFFLDNFEETPSGKIHREKNRVRVLSLIS